MALIKGLFRSIGDSGLSPANTTGRTVLNWLSQIFGSIPAAADLAAILARLDVNLSTRASQATLATLATEATLAAQLDVLLSSRASEATLAAVLAQLDVALSTRGSEVTLAAVLAQLDVALSTRASEVTVATLATEATLAAQLNITLSALRDALEGASNKNFTTLETELAQKVNRATAVNEYTVTMTLADSVPSYSPIIVKDKNGYVNILPIGDLWNAVNAETILTDNKEEVKQIENLRIYSRASHWTPIKHIIRHRYIGNLLRLNTIGALVDVTPNHSVIVNGKGVVDARSLKLGEILSAPRIKSDFGGRAVRRPLFVGTKELAWLYGFFTAEGTAFSFTGGQYTVAFSNRDYSLLEKTEFIFKQNFHQNMHHVKSKTRVGNSIMCISAKNKHTYRYFREMFYTSDRKKKVPDSILNAPDNIKLEYFKGYYSGDGRKPVGNHTWKFNEFSSNSQTLILGILWLISSITGQTYSILYQYEKNRNTIHVQLNKGNGKLRGNRGKLKSILEIPYNGYVYDLETQNHTFATGTLVNVHNTQYPQALPANTKRFQIKTRDGTAFRLAFVTGKVAGSVDPYNTIPTGVVYWEDNIEPSSLTLYVACSIAAKKAEIIAWS